ncbi:hypothetical protein NSE01_25440 [Novosphingobium sediminis]|uniref:Uncharacterized protein n=1 Tax=Novosphingobium sediminis TaxID=707214 RepID=A0A512ALW8_9SPHN|nr:hypothetical protein [Novosphingobium sediminis]GEO00712.1 hypothetical protein NSE01_25440 [Novosphingobium sediminis]
MTAHHPEMLFHLHRSHCIDAFGKAETAIATFLTRHEMAKANVTLAQQLKTLRAIPANPQFSKARRAAAHTALDQLERLLPARNDLVHAEMRLLKGSTSLAAFVNPREQDGVGRLARHFTIDEIEALAKTALDVAGRLEAALQPPRPAASAQAPVED